MQDTWQASGLFNLSSRINLVVADMLERLECLRATDLESTAQRATSYLEDGGRHEKPHYDVFKWGTGCLWRTAVLRMAE